MNHGHPRVPATKLYIPPRSSSLRPAAAALSTPLEMKIETLLGLAISYELIENSRARKPLNDPCQPSATTTRDAIMNIFRTTESLSFDTQDRKYVEFSRK